MIHTVSTLQHYANICAIIITYYPNLRTLETAIAAIHGHVRKIVIVDNGSPEDSIKCMQKIIPGVSAYLISSSKNIGVAAGHNLGIAWARQQGCTHVLLLDQDSVAGTNMVSELLNAHRDLTEKGVRVAAVGPRYEDEFRQLSSFFVRFGRINFRHIRCTPQHRGKYIEVDFLITSGSFISLEIIELIGGMDEELFVDHVDTEWCLRAKSMGYRTFGVCNAVMHHTLGIEMVRVWKRRYVPRRKPLRHYYTFRNSIILYRRPYIPIIWIINDIVRLISMLFFYSLRTAPRFEHAWMMIKGIIDGLRGRAGPYFTV